MKLALLIVVASASNFAFAGDWNCFGYSIRNNRVVDGEGRGLRVVGTWPSPNSRGGDLVYLARGKSSNIVAIQDCYPAVVAKKTAYVQEHQNSGL